MGKIAIPGILVQIANQFANDTTGREISTRLIAMFMERMGEGSFHTGYPVTVFRAVRTARVNSLDSVFLKPSSCYPSETY